VGGVALDITARKRAEQERRILLAKLASAQEDERRRISRELHDDLTQRLAALGMEMGGLLANRQRLSPAIRRQLRLVQRAVIQAAEISRDVAHELHPSELDELGLVATLRSHCRDFARRAGVAVQFVSRTEPSALHRAAASCLYKVAQESLHNVAKHARATRVRVSLEENEDSIRLRVEDNGAGFAPSGPRARAGLGLGNMRDRMELVGGQITVQSRPGHGTRIMAGISSRLARLDSGEHGTQGRK
jgi:signal transduction histidine kinase